MAKRLHAPDPPSTVDLDEIAHILALGVLRLRARRDASNSNDLRDFRLDFSPGRSGHVVPTKTKGRPR